MEKKRRHDSIYWREFKLTAYVAFLALFLLGCSFFTVSYQYLRSEKTEEMTEQARLVAQLSADYLAAETLSVAEDLQLLGAFAASVSEVNFLICNDGGYVLLTSEPRLVGQVVVLPEQIRMQILNEHHYVGRTDISGSYETERLSVGVPVLSAEGALVGMVLAQTETAALLQMWRGLSSLIVLTFVAVLLVAFLASSVMASQQTRPIKEMAEATRRFAEGKFDIRMQDYGRSDEVGELAASFNAMADALQQVERQRKEFMANVSHELKTPMTTIAGYTDGILDGTIPPEKEAQYLHIISDEARRLSRLVRRMLEVSQLQSRELMRNQGQFDVCESARRVLVSMERKITDRGLDVEADIPEAPVLVLGDSDLITQVIYNLLENAAKFATEGSTLYLGIGVQSGKALISVRNQGETIAAQELPLLFERFHKSDRSRNMDKDGVGLGLYIVKTILEQHKEKIMAASEDGVTTFAFTMQLAGQESRG